METRGIAKQWVKVVTSFAALEVSMRTFYRPGTPVHRQVGLLENCVKRGELSGYSKIDLTYDLCCNVNEGNRGECLDKI